MRKNAYGPERVVQLLRGVDAAPAAGKTVAEACGESGVATTAGGTSPAAWRPTR